MRGCTILADVQLLPTHKAVRAAADRKEQSTVVVDVVVVVVITMNINISVIIVVARVDVIVVGLVSVVCRYYCCFCCC